jgi:hypothetical protein
MGRFREWAREKVGIKNPAKEMGKAVADGFTEGIKKKLEIKSPSEEFIRMMGDQSIKDTTAFGTQTVEASARVQKAFGISTDQAIELIQMAKDAGMDKTDMSTLSTPTKDNHTIIDPLLNEIGQVVWDQQEKVLRSGKYEHPIHRTNHTAMEWMDHQMSEFADALVYRECLKQTIEEVAQAITLARSLNQAQEHSATRDRVDHYLGSALDRLGKG